MKSYLHVNPAENVVEREGRPIEEIAFTLSVEFDTHVRFTVTREEAIQFAYAVLEAAVGGVYRSVEFEAKKREF